MDDIESLLQNIHPSVATMVHKSLLTTFVRQIAAHRNNEVELAEISRELGDEDFGSW